MKLNRRITRSLGFAALVGAAAVEAEQLGKAEVPFAFEVSGQKMNAGTYTAVRRTQGAVLIQNVATGKAVFVAPGAPNTTSRLDSSLTFTCYGSNCFLSQMRFYQTNRSYSVPVSHHEKELARVDQPERKLIAMR